MKRIIYFMISLFCMVAISCVEVLEKEPLGVIDISSAYVTALDAASAVTAAYTPAAANNWCCTYAGPGFMHWVLANVASDDTEKGGESGSDQLYAQQVSLFNIPSDNDAVRFAWSSQYIGIRRANLVLENIPTIPMDENLKNRYLAEVKFLRAWYYINLVKTFGDVPLILSTKSDAKGVTRAPKAQVYAQIIKDLEEAEKVLPAKHAVTERGRATKGAAQAYLGKVYLYLDNFPKAEEWFGKVINSGVYELSTSYYNMFLRAGETSNEHIFQVQFLNDQGPVILNNQLNIVMGSRARNGWGFNLPTKDFVDAFEPGDPRLGHTVYKNGDVMPDGLIANVGNSTTGYLNKKYYAPEFERVGGALQPGRDDIYMRLGKVLLWYAEAANENGNTQAALLAINNVRKRAREGNANVLPNIVTTDKNALRLLIWQEQRVEFGQEFERFFELVRQKRAGAVMRAYAAKYATPKGSGFKDKVNEIFPVPQAEINLSAGSITQNPGF